MNSKLSVKSAAKMAVFLFYIKPFFCYHKYMKISHLQRYVLGLGYAEKDKFGRGKILRFYDKQKRPPKLDDRVNIVTKSLERLIDKGFLIGYGVRTPKKWFIKEIKLTAAGRKAAKSLQGKQVPLPFK